MDPAALHAAVCRADAEDPRLLGRRSAGEAKVQEKSRPEEPLLRPGRAKVVQEVKVRAAKCKESEIRGLLREGMFVTIHEVCSKSARVEYGLTGLSGWVTLRKNSEAVLKEDPWASRPPVKKVPKASEPAPETREKVDAKLVLAHPGTKPAGSCAGDHRGLPESAWQKIHDRFRGEPGPGLKYPDAKTQHGQAGTSRAQWGGDHRSLPQSAWQKIHDGFRAEPAPCMKSLDSQDQHGEASAFSDEGSGDNRSLPESGWKRRIRDTWKRIQNKFRGEPAPCMKSLDSQDEHGEASTHRAHLGGDHRSLPEFAWKRIHDQFQGQPAPCLASPFSTTQPGKTSTSRAQWGGDHRSLPQSAWQKIHDSFVFEPAPCMKTLDSQDEHGEASTHRAHLGGDHRSLPEFAWKRIHDRFQGQPAPCLASPDSTTQQGKTSTSRAQWGGDHRSLPQSAWQQIHDSFRGEPAQASTCRAHWGGDHRSLPESAWKRIHDKFHAPRSLPESAAASDWWQAFWQQAVRDLCCSR